MLIKFLLKWFYMCVFFINAATVKSLGRDKNLKYLQLRSVSARDPPALAFRWQARSSSAQGSGLPVHLLPLFLKPFPFSRTLSSLALPSWRRLGEWRCHFSRLHPALCRRRAHPPGMPAPSISFCCARRSTPNPNKTICIRI